MLAPERVDQPVRWNDPPCLQQEDREQGPLLLAAELERLAVIERLERSEDAELETLLNAGEADDRRLRCCRKLDLASCNGPHGGGRAEGRELLGQSVDYELKEVLRVLEPLQAMNAEIAEPQPLQLVLVDQGARGPGEEDLAAVTRGANARAPDDPESVVAIFRETRLRCVDADPDLDADFVRPFLARDRALSCGRRLDCVARPAEGDEEGVALRVDLVSAATRKRLAKQAMVGREQCSVVVPKPADERRGAFDVREQERDGPPRHAGRAPTVGRGPVGAFLAVDLHKPSRP